jgi:hypothetical protein
MRLLISILLGIFLTGCSCFLPSIQQTKTQKIISDFGGVENIEKVAALESLTILSGIGGLCLLSGIVLLTISRGTMGWRPIIGGIVLIVLNFVISVYASWIFLPIIGATGAISLVWGYSNIRDMLKIKKEKANG